MTPLATPAQLPPVLRDPPWARGERAPEPPRLALPPWAPAATLDVAAAAQPACDDARSASVPYVRPPMTPAEQEAFLDAVGVRPEARAGLRAGAPLQPQDLGPALAPGWVDLSQLLYLPEPMALALWRGVPHWPATWEDTLQALLRRHGPAAVPLLVAQAERRPVQGLRVCRGIDSPELARIALGARRRLRIARDVSAAWLLAHPQTSAQVLLRQLCGSDDARREDARAALHDTGLHGLHPALRQAAATLGPLAEAGLREQLAADPLLHLPARLPRLPAFVDTPAAQRPRLAASGAALPDEALRHVALMLAISKPGQPYAGLQAVREACDPASLAAWAWTLFEAWWAAEAPGAHAWCFHALALLGDDTTAHRLGARTMQMAREGAKQRALAAIDMLADFGSDAALMHLSHLAERCKVPAVRNRAAARTDAVAQERGLTRAELADRLVPTLGLDEDRVLDFGPRRFEIGFDETLTPHLRDAAGARLKDLPRPGARDDPVKSAAAVLRWKALKQELRTLARVQVARLEEAMVAQRRWPAADFHRCFVVHPLMRELAARLVWSVRDAQGRPAGACRIAEDGLLADADDRTLLLPAGAQLAIAHPLLLPAALAEGFRQGFVDYELLQPFPQLQRDVYAPTAEEAAGHRIERWVGQDVATGAVIGLLERGWLRDRPGDGGVITAFLRPLVADAGEAAAGVRAVLRLAPGMPVTRLSEHPRQVLGAVHVQDAEGHPVPLSRIDPIAYSELLRDLSRLTPTLPRPTP